MEERKPTYIVDGYYRVVTIDEFDADPSHCKLKMPGGEEFDIDPALHRLGKKEFTRRRDAEKHAREMCEEHVERARQELLRLKNILKVKRPWEKK